MSLLTFQCPVCFGMFRAEETTTEVNCPHCHETIGLGDEDQKTSPKVDSDQPTAVETSVTRVRSSSPLLPPGFKRTDGVSEVSDDKKNNKPNAPPKITPPDQESQISGDNQLESQENRSVREIGENDGGVEDKIGRKTEASRTAVPGFMASTSADIEELPVNKTDDLIEVLDDSQTANNQTGEQSTEELSQEVAASFEPEVLLSSSPKPVEELVEDDLAGALEQLDAVIDDEMIDSSILPPTIDGGSVEPGEKRPLPMPEVQTKESVNTTKAVESVSINLSEQPKTVGHGLNKIELMSRTSDERAQFKRNKNVIVWTIGALLILLTMLIMVNLP